MIGEKLIEVKIDGNKINRISKFKEFNYDYLDIATQLNDKVNDDPEYLFSRGLCIDYDDFYSLDADNVLEWVEEIIDEKIQDGEDEEELEWLKNMIIPLREAKGFNIYLNKNKKDYNNWKEDN